MRDRLMLSCRQILRHSSSQLCFRSRLYSVKNVVSKSIRKLKLNENVSKIRNIGISAHIDAGKTTTTERMLFYSGFIQHMGEVHDGNTVTDYMLQERNRGITIRSAAVSISWMGHVINIIDTPGHIDFTMEVEQALNVMDGAVIVLDASAGVEAQTVTVWRQADKFSIPRLVYVNKMDRQDANLKLCVKSIEERFGVKSLVLQIPIVGSKGGLVGLVDLISLEKILWMGDQGRDVIAKQISDTDSDIYEEALSARGALVESLSDFDNSIAEQIISDGTHQSVSSSQIKKALRSAVLNSDYVPVVCGSSYKNIGVQKLMDAIVDILPSPNDRSALHIFKYFGDNLCARAFKVIHDKHKGAVTFFRIYSGCFKKGQKLFNISSCQSEQIVHLLLAEADDFKDVDEIGCGNIAAVTGLKHTMCGDLICANEKSYRSVNKSLAKEKKLGEEQVREMLNVRADIPDPVFFCSIEPPSQSVQVSLDEALNQLQREDPSLRVSINPDTGQTVLGGMGELHLEIIRDRILSEYKIDAELGPLQIAYKETILRSAKDSHEYKVKIGTSSHHVLITLSVLPGDKSKSLVSLDRSPEHAENTNLIYPRRLQCIKQGVDSALLSGPKLGCPVVDVRILVHHLEVGRGTSDSIISSCTTQCVHKILNKAGCILLEPYMSLQIISDEKYIHPILGDLSRRRAEIKSVEERLASKVIEVEAPLAELLGYCQQLRILSSGRAHFTMELVAFREISAQHEAQAVKNITGFYPE